MQFKNVQLYEGGCANCACLSTKTRACVCYKQQGGSDEWVVLMRGSGCSLKLVNKV